MNYFLLFSYYSFNKYGKKIKYRKLKHSACCRQTVSNKKHREPSGCKSVNTNNTMHIIKLNLLTNSAVVKSSVLSRC